MSKSAVPSYSTARSCAASGHRRSWSDKLRIVAQAQGGLRDTTDINFLLDALRKTIETCGDLCEAHDLTEWRQSAYRVRQFKRGYRKLQQLKQ